MKSSYILSCIASILALCASSAYAQDKMQWPEGKRVAVSLTFDDGRDSQVLRGTQLLDKYGVKATFFVVPGAVRRQHEGWKKAVASGHEIGNHSLHHPCSGNFPWSRNHALESYSIADMKAELTQANKEIQSLLGVAPRVFAYPCGQTFVGRGTETKSYVPVVAEMFLLGRTWMDEAPNDPLYCDFAQLTGIEMDGKEFSQIKTFIESARENGAWLVLAGHEMGDEGPQTTRLRMLEELLAYAADPANGVWIAPVGEVADYVQSGRKN
ncbi:MAG TPA: polysaccharide deacetylase family protein [Cyclobacteriaceae bacterium]|jgi:peptidoglycan/xylan/chitin deacetylase (PgdA/CDA1 family)